MIWELIQQFTAMMIAFVVSFTGFTNLGGTATSTPTHQTNHALIVSDILSDTRVTVAVSRVEAAVETYQNNYILSHKSYWQGLSTHSSIPKNGISVVADRVNKTPRDVKEKWTDVLVTTKFPFLVEVNTVPNGYYIVFKIDYQEHAFTKIIDHSTYGLEKEW